MMGLCSTAPPPQLTLLLHTENYRADWLEVALISVRFFQEKANNCSKWTLRKCFGFPSHFFLRHPKNVRRKEFRCRPSHCSGSGLIWPASLRKEIPSQLTDAIDKNDCPSKDSMPTPPPAKTHNLENLITVCLMGQLYDGVYDVLANLLLTSRSAQTFFLPPHHLGRPTRPNGRKTKAWLRSKKGRWVVKIRERE